MSKRAKDKVGDEEMKDDPMEEFMVSGNAPVEDRFSIGADDKKREFYIKFSPIVMAHIQERKRKLIAGLSKQELERLSEDRAAQAILADRVQDELAVEHILEMGIVDKDGTVKKRKVSSEEISGDGDKVLSGVLALTATQHVMAYGVPGVELKK